jgi:gelsolin
MLLDAWDSLFLWIGSGSNKQESEESEKIVFDYLKTDPSLRGSDLPIYKIRQGMEPSVFTGFFGTWEKDAFEKVLKKLIFVNTIQIFFYL